MSDRPPRISSKASDNWFRLLPRQWKEKVSGEIRIQMVFKQEEKRSLMPADFEILQVLGKGSFGKVYQVKKTDTGRIYAMKVLYKKDIIERQEVAHTMSERNILKHTNFPYLVGLKFAFQTKDRLYLVLDFMNGGELFYHLQQAQSFNEERAKFYAAQILLALEHLHRHNVIYRDLKPGLFLEVD
jgi:serine/threonine protein kinase